MKMKPRKSNCLQHLKYKQPFISIAITNNAQIVKSINNKAIMKMPMSFGEHIRKLHRIGIKTRHHI